MRLWREIVWYFKERKRRRLETAAERARKKRFHDLIVGIDSEVRREIGKSIFK